MRGREFGSVQTPADLGADAVAGLVERLAAPGLLPGLRAEGVEFADVVESFRADAGAAARLLLKQAVAAEAKTRAGGVRVLLLLDQLEEVLARKDRAALLGLLEALARSGAVWVAATVRGDFMGEVHADPTLARRIGEVEIAGERCGKEWLDEQILEEVKDSPDALPLLEVCLERLYEDTLDPEDERGLRRASDLLACERGARFRN